jgi:hypothetical protein
VDPRAEVLCALVRGPAIGIKFASSHLFFYCDLYNAHKKEYLNLSFDIQAIRFELLFFKLKTLWNFYSHPPYLLTLQSGIHSLCSARRKLVADWGVAMAVDAAKTQHRCLHAWLALFRERDYERALYAKAMQVWHGWVRPQSMMSQSQNQMAEYFQIHRRPFSTTAY